MSCCSKLGHTSFQAIALWIQFMVTREPAMIRVTQLMYRLLTDTTAVHVDTDNERVLLFQININQKLLQISGNIRRLTASVRDYGESSACDVFVAAWCTQNDDVIRQQRQGTGVKLGSKRRRVRQL